MSSLLVTGIMGATARSHVYVFYCFLFLYKFDVSAALVCSYSNIWLTLPETDFLNLFDLFALEKRPGPKMKGSSPNHPFSGASS